jgi:hypothetical protein
MFLRSFLRCFLPISARDRRSNRSKGIVVGSGIVIAKVKIVSAQVAKGTKEVLWIK